MHTSTLSARRTSRGLFASIAMAALTASLAVVSPAAANGFDDVEYDGTSERRSGATQGAGGTVFESAAAGLVTGTVLIFDPEDSGPIPVSGGRVQFYSASDPYVLVDDAITNASGEYSVSGLPAGDYKVAFSSYDDLTVPAREWLGDATAWLTADTITLEEGEPFTLDTVTMRPRLITSSRLAGADRFATAAEVAEALVEPASGGTVFVVNGLDYPDALSAGGASRDDPLLMVTPTSIPAVTAAQLTRIEPDRIVVVGGTGVVSNSVFTALQGYVDSPSDVVRLAGANRFATSRTVILSPEGLNGDVDALFIATGLGFADALAAVPPAVAGNAGIMLVNGAASQLDAASLALVEDLAVPVFIIGGTGVVSAGIEAQVTELVGDPFIERVAGSNRFETSVAVALQFFEEADYAFVVNAFGFPDALAAGPLAGLLHSPVYLIQRTCVPDVVVDDILDVLANTVASVGGTGVISEEAASGRPCSDL